MLTYLPYVVMVLVVNGASHEPITRSTRKGMSFQVYIWADSVNTQSLYKSGARWLVRTINLREDFFRMKL